MAKLDNEIPFTGTFGNLSAYRRKDIDKIILRRKGGATKEKIRKGDEFVNVRRNNVEFGGRATAAKYIRKAIWPLKLLADYNFTPHLVGLLKTIQEQDISSEFGKRSVSLSVKPQLLNGFNLNKVVPLDSIIRNPLTATISVLDRSATVEIPALLPGINFFTRGKYPFYSVIVSLGEVPDLIYTGNGYAPSAPLEHEQMAYSATDWLPVLTDSPPIKLTVQLPNTTPRRNCSLLLGAGIRFANLLEAGKAQQAKYAGAARIVAVSSGKE